MAALSSSSSSSSSASPSPLPSSFAVTPCGHRVFTPTWDEGAPRARAFVPPLAMPDSGSGGTGTPLSPSPSVHTSYKGSAGRVAVFGGSKEYTGAPFYAATTALKVGADLAFVLCAEEAAVPIKCYGPELMVSQ